MFVRPSPLLPAAAALALIATTGCATEALVQAGPAVPLVKGGRPAAALEAVVGLGPGDDHQGFGLESRFRCKFGSDVTSASLNSGLFFTGGSYKAEKLFVFGNVGLSFIGASYTQQKTFLDFGSPYAQLGMGHPLSKGAPALTGSLFVDYSVQIGAAPNTPYAGLMFGIGDVSYSNFHLR